MGVVLFRRLLGDVLRSRRVEQGRTLRQLCGEARVSLGYMSEIERGRKEASSELLSAICTALDVPLSEILSEVADAVALEEAAMAVRLEQVATTRPLGPSPVPPSLRGPLREQADEPVGLGQGDPTGDVVASAA